MNCFLKLRDISKSYLLKQGNLSVLKDINMCVQKNEFVTVVGPSGSGKSTLLEIIAGFLKPGSGDVLKNGQILTDPDMDRIMVFQSFEQLFPWKTVLENVVFPLQVTNTGKSKREKISTAQKYLSKVQLSEFTGYYPHQLSGGMKQRVALARALITEPEILLMDEPFGSLDSQTRSSLQNMLLGLWQKHNISIIFVTHDIREAIILSDKIIVLDKETGSVKRVVNNELARPRNCNTEKFRLLYQQICNVL